MKKLFTLIAITGMLSLTGLNTAYGQGGADGADDPAVEETNDTMATPAPAPPAEPVEQPEDEMPAEEGAEEEGTVDMSTEQTLKKYFIEGGPLFMSIVLVALILGLALSIERIVYLNMASTNTKKLLNKVENALSSGGIEAAKEVCRNTPGPIAAIFYQGLDRSNDSIENAEKSVLAYGSVQAGLLEKGLSWIALFIALAPMLGFMGTVIGMIKSFDFIEQAEDIVISDVAKGIKVALLTTVFGLIVAIILQIFYNYIVSKIDGLINEMEDASISLIDMLIRHQEKSGNA